MAFICAMTLTSCDEIMSKMDNPVDSYLKVDAEVFVKEGSAVELYAETISDAEVTYTVGDEKIAKVEKVSNHEVKVIGVKPGETVIDVKLAANAYYKAGEAKVKVVVTPAVTLKDAVVDGAKLKIGYKFAGEDYIFAYEFDASQKVFIALDENNVPEAITNLYEVSITYDGDGKITQKLVSKKNEDLVPFVLNLHTAGSFDRIYKLPIELKSVVVNNYDVLPYVPESVTPVDQLVAGLLPDNMPVGDKGLYPISFFPDNATNQVIKYTSSDPNVITIDAAGNFEAKAAGTATIKAETTDGTGKFVEKEITVIAKTPATVTTAPTAKTGVKAGENAAIINAGVTSDGTMMYAVTTTNTKPTTTDGFSATVPTAQSLAAGTCYVWYYVKGDATHDDSEIAGPVQVTIASAIISTKDVSETFTATANTVTKTYFRVSGTKTNYGWQIGTGNHQTITISSPDGLNLSQVVLTVGTHPGTPQRNPSHLEVNHGTLTVTGTTPDNTVTISNINSPSVTLSAPGSNDNASRWTFTQAVVDGKGDASK